MFDPNRSAGRIFLGLAALSFSFLASTLNATTVTYPFDAVAGGSVDGGQIDQNCGSSSGGAGFTAATFSCGPADFGTVSSTVDLIAGFASVSATATNINAGAAGQATFDVQGTISGNGTLDWFDHGIAVSGFGDIFLTILGPGNTILGSTCFQTTGLFGCSSSTSIDLSQAVTNGEVITLSYQMKCGISGSSGPATCNVVDPIGLNLSSGVQFNSSVPGLFSGGGGSTTPEPGSLLLIGTGLLSLPWLRQRTATLFRRIA